MSSATTKAKALTTWTCDRCSFQQTEEGERDDSAPRGWRWTAAEHLTDHHDEHTQRRDLCPDCVKAFASFMLRHWPLPPRDDDVPCAHAASNGGSWCPACGAIRTAGAWQEPTLLASSSELRRLRALHELGIQAQNDLDELVTQLNWKRPLAIERAVDTLRATLNKWIHEDDDRGADT